MEMEGPREVDIVHPVNDSSTAQLLSTHSEDSCVVLANDYTGDSPYSGDHDNNVSSNHSPLKYNDITEQPIFFNVTLLPNHNDETKC